MLMIVYVPLLGRDPPAWLESLPDHTLVRTHEGLSRALTQPLNMMGKLCVALLLPSDGEDLEALATLGNRFSGWKVLLELPSTARESLSLARPLRPRFFMERGENPSYLLGVVSRMMENEKLQADDLQPG